MIRGRAVLRSIVNILGGLASLQAAFDWDLNAGQTEARQRSIHRGHRRRIRDLNTNFGGIRSASLLTKSKNFLKTAVETYALASPTGEFQAWNGGATVFAGSEDLNEESDFKGDLDELYLLCTATITRGRTVRPRTLFLSNFSPDKSTSPLLPELVGDWRLSNFRPYAWRTFSELGPSSNLRLMLDAELSIPQPKG